MARVAGKTERAFALVGNVCRTKPGRAVLRFGEYRGVSYAFPDFSTTGLGLCCKKIRSAKPTNVLRWMAQLLNPRISRMN